MATATYNSVGRIVQFDLNAAEAAVIEELVAAKGLTPIEAAFNELLREHRQRRRELEVSRIKDKIDNLTDAQRRQILAILT